MNTDLAKQRKSNPLLDPLQPEFVEELVEVDMTIKGATV